MNVCVFQHVAFEGLGSIAAWLEVRRAVVTTVRFYEPEPVLPDPDGIDLLIVMGGPMSVNDEAELPWLKAEKAFVRERIARGGAVVGICLGAQLIAAACGCRVYAGRHKEIGWFPVEAEQAADGGFCFSGRPLVFHWHGETFDLPDHAVRLARSAGCANQAFRIGRRVVGLQFHLETTPATVAAMIAHCGHELVDGPFIQSAGQMREQAEAVSGAVNGLMADVLDAVTA